MIPVDERTDSRLKLAQTETARPILQVDAISKSFGANQAVRDLTFEARSGEIIGLLGPNGAGKTTAIRMLSTIVTPTRGSFTVDGIPHTRPVEIRRRIGVLPESSGYPLRSTGEEYLRYYGRLFGLSPSQATSIADSLLAEVGLADRASSQVSTYSRGMRQRLGVARALIHDPRLIFLDEPTLGLDPAGQRQMLALIRDLARQRGATVILSTHFLDEVEETCSRVLILHRGVLIAEGSIADITRRAAPRAAQFRVSPELIGVATAVLERVEGVTEVKPVEDERSWLTAMFDPVWLDQHPSIGINSAVQALIDARIPILSFEREGGRLSDAFLTLTEEGQR